MNLHVKYYCFLFLGILFFCCDHELVTHQKYVLASSQTRLISNYEMLSSLPDNPLLIAEIASAQMIHHNNLQSFNIPNNGKSTATPFLPNFSNILGALGNIEPFTLSLDRAPENRLIGACISESYFLAGLLRFKGIPVRVRAGTLKILMKIRSILLTFGSK